MNQITKQEFEQALTELGHDPKEYIGRRLSLSNMGELYDLDQDTIMEAIDEDLLSAHYDYSRDTIWIDALDAAHFYYCLRSKMSLFNQV